MRLFVLAAGLVLAISSTHAAPASTAPTVQTLLQKHAEAVGPVDRLQTRRVKLHITGMAPFDLPVVVEAARPNLIRKDVTIQDSVQTTAFDGKRAWKTDPFVAGGATPSPLPSAEAKALLDEADFDSALIKPDSRGIKVSYAGPDTLLGKPVHELRVTLQSGAAVTVWLDGATYLETKRTMLAPVMGKMQMIDTWSSDYRVVQGIRLPHRIDSGLSGAKERIAIIIDAVELDPGIDRARFSTP